MNYASFQDNIELTKDNETFKNDINFDLCGMSIDSKHISSEFIPDEEGYIWLDGEIHQPLSSLGKTIWKSKCGNYSAVFPGVEKFSDETFMNHHINGKLYNSNMELSGTTVLMLNGGCHKLLCMRIVAVLDKELDKE